MNAGDRERIALLIERVVAGAGSATDVAALTAWRRASPANEAEYRRCERLVRATRDLAGEVNAPPPPTAAEVIARAGWSRSRPSPRRLQAVRFAAVLSAAAALVLLLVVRGGEAVGWSPTEVTTGAAERATLTLPDGTVVRLAPSSRLRVERGRVREVRLEGRAFFAVAHQPHQPFRVFTQEGTVNVLGTRFELATGEASLRLRVIEGRVALDAARNTVEVAAGEQTEVREGAATVPTPLGSAPEPDPEFGRFLAFQTTPLRDVAAEIERLYAVRIAIADSALSASTVTATFTDRSLVQVIDVLCEVLGARCAIEADSVSVTR